MTCECLLLSLPTLLAQCFASNGSLFSVSRNLVSDCAFADHSVKENPVRRPLGLLKVDSEPDTNCTNGFFVSPLCPASFGYAACWL